MKYANAMVLQGDPTARQSLVACLSDMSFSVHVVQKLDELRAGIIRNRPDVVILDMEIASLKALHHLCGEFPRVSVVCTHRLADEDMWTDALNAGAADVCLQNDPRSILSAALRTTTPLHSAAA
jgi:DNA-binding NarL/FixJ family response regulator